MEFLYASIHELSVVCIVRSSLISLFLILSCDSAESLYAKLLEEELTCSVFESIYLSSFEINGTLICKIMYIRILTGLITKYVAHSNRSSQKFEMTTGIYLFS